MTPEQRAATRPPEARALFRDGLVTPTAGWSAGFTQRNPEPCPLLDVLDPGATAGALLDGDVRTDVSRYRVFLDGELVEETSDVTARRRSRRPAGGVDASGDCAPGGRCGPRDLVQPGYGESVAVREGEVPVFWACGVTPQAVVAESRPPLAITHAPGHMPITDGRDADLLVP